MQATPSISSNRYSVAKFGGTSVATHEAMTRCANILKNYSQVCLVVVSAPAGVTNLLVKLTHAPAAETTVIIADIKQKIRAILAMISTAAMPGLSQIIEKMLDELEPLTQRLITEKKPALLDELLSYGERMSAQLFVGVLLQNGFSAIHQDARMLIKTNHAHGKAAVLMDETNTQVAARLQPLCADHLVVTEGFIGSTLENITTTLGRGGSDYSAALLAEALNADVLQIWTDVPGIYTVDPGLASKAKPIANMTFTEAAELATFGAKILHPATLWPAIRKNIPVFVGSSMQPQAQGTWITADELASPKPLLRAIALRRHQTLLTISSLEMLQTHGFLAKVFAILARYHLSVDLVTTSEISVALTMNNADIESLNEDRFNNEVLVELQAIGNVSLKLDKQLSLIALVGNNLHLTPGLSGLVFNALSPFNIRLICHGASSHNLCFLVNEVDEKAVIGMLHATFFESDKALKVSVVGKSHI